MSKYVTETAAAKSVSAYIILNRKGEHVATVRAYFGNSGRCLVNVHDDKAGFQHGSAGGYGYDKFTAALSGLTIDGHELSNHCSTEGIPKKPKGRVTYPADMKAPRGYAFANFCTISRATGKRLNSYDWQDAARKELGISQDPRNTTEDQFRAICEKARELETAWRASDDCEFGWESCHRKSGLDYLQAIGYRVIQAI